jgi:hypothetical protein
MVNNEPSELNHPKPFFVQETATTEARIAPHPQIEHPSEGQDPRNRRPGRLSEVTRRTGAETDKHSDLNGCFGRRPQWRGTREWTSRIGAESTVR